MGESREVKAWKADAMARRLRSEALLRWCKENNIAEIAHKLDAEAKRIEAIRRKYREGEEETEE